MSPILGIWASQNYTRYQLPTSYESIATVTVGAGGSSSLTFSSIPSTYTHLQIRGIGRMSSTGSRVRIEFNSDTTQGNYAQHSIYGDGSSVVTEAETASNNIMYLPRNDEVSNLFGLGIIDILDYTNTNKNTTTRTLHGFDRNGSGFTFFSSLLWKNTSAVTNITLVATTANFAQYSSFALYGIKGI